MQFFLLACAFVFVFSLVYNCVVMIFVRRSVRVWLMRHFVPSKKFPHVHLTDVVSHDLVKELSIFQLKEAVASLVPGPPLPLSNEARHHKKFCQSP